VLGCDSSSSIGCSSSSGSSLLPGVLQAERTACGAASSSTLSPPVRCPGGYVCTAVTTATATTVAAAAAAATQQQPPSAALQGGGWKMGRWQVWTTSRSPLRCQVWPPCCMYLGRGGASSGRSLGHLVLCVWLACWACYPLLCAWLVCVLAGGGRGRAMLCYAVGLPARVGTPKLPPGEQLRTAVQLVGVMCSCAVWTPPAGRGMATRSTCSLQVSLFGVSTTRATFGTGIHGFLLAVPACPVYGVSQHVLGGQPAVRFNACCCTVPYSCAACWPLAC
jgi:hypothetical protein